MQTKTTKTPELRSEASAPQNHKMGIAQASLEFPYGHILALQQGMGNRTVQRLLRSHAVQAKLTIGRPHDIYEQEADQVADAVMRMADPSVIGLRSSIDGIIKSKARSPGPGVRGENDIIRMKAG